MLRPATSRLSLATLPRVHVRFFATTLPLKQDRGSRPQSDPASNKVGGGIEHAQSIIRRWSEQNSIAFRQRTDSLIARLATSFTRLGGEINKVTGYDEIEALKRQVVSQEARISASRKAARDAKVSYEEAVQKRSDSQREVNSLLERKSMWSDADVSRFTVLVRQDHALEQEESRAKAAVGQTEDEVEREFSALMRTILARYHEEQIWSDKIRSVSTYGQLAVLAVNVIVFVLAIMLVEPWKRRRLTQAFERKVQEMEMANLDVVNKGMDALQRRLEKQEEIILAQLAGGTSSSTAPPPSAPVLLEQQRAAAGVENSRPVVKFAGITLALHDANLIAASVSASVSAGILAWALRGWLGL